MAWHSTARHGMAQHGTARHVCLRITAQQGVYHQARLKNNNRQVCIDPKLKWIQEYLEKALNNLINALPPPEWSRLSPGGCEIMSLHSHKRQVFAESMQFSI
ncbi:Stromal cell-derived factor 1 [Tupaia chinensis]|uniref:Stromal cell-derived factor 1 n=1 Tax=Tupaia chinensis TaxID=246437 RepID=L9KVL8_TUPCH|nr:Stromal cell-derived factor 1 [Tupaia chinensis]